MGWEIEYTDEFKEWWDHLEEDEQESVDASVGLLERLGVALGHPHSSDIRGSQHSNMRELIVQHKGKPYRILYAFDPRRVAILLIGGNKTGKDRWYKEFVPKADKIYAQHLIEIKKEEHYGKTLQKTKSKNVP